MPDKSSCSETVVLTCLNLRSYMSRMKGLDKAERKAREEAE